MSVRVDVSRSVCPGTRVECLPFRSKRDDVIRMFKSEVLRGIPSHALQTTRFLVLEAMPVDNKIPVLIHSETTPDDTTFVILCAGAPAEYVFKGCIGLCDIRAVSLKAMTVPSSKSSIYYIPVGMLRTLTLKYRMDYSINIEEITPPE